MNPEDANEIAQRHGIPTLDTRGSDSLDFYDVSVWQLRDMLAEAYELGQRSTLENRA